MRKLTWMTLLALVTGIGSARNAIDLKRPATTHGKVRVVVQYAVQPQERHFRRVTDAQGRVEHKFSHLPMAAYDLTESALVALENDPDVVYISPDREVHGTLENTGASVNLPSILNYYNSIQRAKAAGVGIAIIDSGLDPTQPYFTTYLSSPSRILHSESFIDSTPNDLYGHGTHVAAAVAVPTTSLPLSPASSTHIGVWRPMPASSI